MKKARKEEEIVEILKASYLIVTYLIYFKGKTAIVQSNTNHVM
jgi:hypothetical protein